MYILLYMTVLLLALLPGHVEPSCYNPPSDLCSVEMTEIPSMETRDPSVQYTNVTANVTFCDVYAISVDQWYKSESNMSTNCPSIYACGTKHPIWMNGTNPSPDDGLVNGTSCVRDFEVCCLYGYRLTALNCGGFMAYCFVDLPDACDQRYCFDNGPMESTPNPTQASSGNDSSTSATQEGNTGLSTEASTTDSAVWNCYNATKDVCNSEISHIPSLETRSTTYFVNSVTFNSTFCDLYAIRRDTWYKSESNMSTTCPSMYTCGTKFPIWMDGQNPSPDDGLVNRTSCLRDFTDCCLLTYNITAINCGAFMAYCFVEAPASCHQRYCFDYIPASTTPSSMATDISTEENQTPGFIPTPSNDGKLLTIALAVIGLLTAIIFGLLVIITRRKRMSKVNDKGDESNDYNTLKQPAVNVIDGKDVEHVYRTRSFVNPTLDQLRESHVYSTPTDPFSTEADKDHGTLAKDEEGLYDGENYYVKMT